VNLWARAKDGDHARRILNNALRHSTAYNTDQYKGGIYYNLYDSHAPFQIDGNFGVCAGMAEMLLQSQNEVIEILPALPRAWKNGSVTGLKAVGDFTVDVAWKNLLPSEVNIVSHKGQPMRIKVAGNTQKPGEEIDPYKFDLTLVKVLVNGRGAKVIPVETKDKKHPTFEIKALVGDQIMDVPAGAKIIDVREDYEWEGGHVAGAQHITLGTLTERLSELPSKDEEFYVICHGGGRSNRAAEYLRQNGYQAKNIAGGTSAWFTAKLPMESENGQEPAVVH